MSAGIFRGTLLKSWRISKGLSQVDAGKKVGITQVFWGELERGTKQPSAEMLVLLSKATGISVDAFLGNPTQPLPTQEPEQGEREAI